LQSTGLCQERYDDNPLRTIASDESGRDTETLVKTGQETIERGTTMNAHAVAGSKSSNSKTRLAAFAAAALLALTGAAAVAQPAGGPWHGHGHGGVEIENVLAALKGQLTLNTSQQLMWDNAVAQTKAAHDAGRAGMQKVRDAMTAELAKAEPDLAAVAAVADSVRASNQTLRQGVRDQWLKIYATFTPEQKGVVRDALQKRMARMQQMLDKMRMHMQNGG
jgi:Spy/CpxP family protein refolding chaperone